MDNYQESLYLTANATNEQAAQVQTEAIRPRFCRNCGLAMKQEAVFCERCGTRYLEDPTRQPYAYAPMQSAPVQAQVAPSVAPIAPTPAPVKRKTYTAQKFVSMGFAIGDTVFAVIFGLLGIVFIALTDELLNAALEYDIYSYSYRDYVYGAEAFYALGIVFIVIGVIALIGSVIAWCMFRVYSKRRREVYRLIAEEKKQAESKDALDMNGMNGMNAQYGPNGNTYL